MKGRGPTRLKWKMTELSLDLANTARLGCQATHTKSCTTLRWPALHVKSKAEQKSIAPIFLPVQVRTGHCNSKTYSVCMFSCRNIWSVEHVCKERWIQRDHQLPAWPKKKNYISKPSQGKVGSMNNSIITIQQKINGASKYLLSRNRDGHARLIVSLQFQHQSHHLNRKEIMISLPLNPDLNYLPIILIISLRER